MSSFDIQISAINGTGSQSASFVLAKSLFRMGFFVKTHNVFPSNIAGLPTQFFIHVDAKPNVAFKNSQCKILLALNPKTIEVDLKSLSGVAGAIASGATTSSVAILDQKTYELKKQFLPKSGNLIVVPFDDLLKPITTSFQLKKLLKNVMSVGIISELLQIPDSILKATLNEVFKAKSKSILSLNQKAFQAGKDWVAGKNWVAGKDWVVGKDWVAGKGWVSGKDWVAGKDWSQGKLPSSIKTREHLKTINFLKLPQLSEEQKKYNQKNNIFIDGNTAGALGSIVGGCRFVSWYPITPATSFSEAFEKYASRYFQIDDKNLQTKKDQKNYVCLQTEDEISALCSVIGAGFAGTRALTVTSSPGLSLMSEAAGLSYYTETPAVLWNIGRLGPSTGLPTRTSQSDLLNSCFLSHGDTKHIVLLPSNPNECFEMAQKALDLAERFQTLVIVLSDLDLGMNFYTSPMLQLSKKPWDRGKLITDPKDQRLNTYARYKDVDNDGVSYRTLPGTEHSNAAFFARGSGHDEEGNYSEDPEVYKKTMDRLNKKWKSIQKAMDLPIIEDQKSSVCFVAFGSSVDATQKFRSLLLKKQGQKQKQEQGQDSNFLQIVSYPFHSSVGEFLKTQKSIFVVEQNRDAQLKKLLSMEYPDLAHKFVSILQYNGLPLKVQSILNQWNCFNEREENYLQKKQKREKSYLRKNPTKEESYLWKKQKKVFYKNGIKKTTNLV